MKTAAKAKIASGLLFVLMALAWFTLEPGRIRLVTLLILGLFLFRVVVHAARSRHDGREHDEDEQD